MALTAEQKEYADELGFSEEEFEKAFPNDRYEKLTKGYAKNKDYTIKTQAVAEEKKRIEQDRAATDAEKQRLAQWKSSAEQQLADALDKVQASTLRGAALEAKLQRIATEFNLDADELMKDVLEQRADDPARTQQQQQQAKVDLSNHVTKDELHSQMTAIGMLPVMTRDLEREYRKLYNKEYEGSLEELVTESFKEIASLQAQGQNINFKDHMRTKLGFAEQAKRNDEAERERWKEETRKELETDIRSKLSAENPARFQEVDRQESPFLKKKDRTPEIPIKGPAQDHARRQGIYAAFQQERQKHSADTN